MKKILSILAISGLTSCGASENHLVGSLDSDVPSLTKAEASFQGTNGRMILEYRQGSSWANVDTTITVNKSGFDYEITRSDDKVKLKFSRVDAFMNNYVCSDCALIYQGKVPLLWILE